MKFSLLLILLFCLGYLPSHKGSPLHASNDVENGILEEVVRNYSPEFASLPDNFDEGSEDNSVFDKLLEINEKSENSRSGNEEKLIEGDIVVTESLEEMIENRKRGAASISKRHLWPVNNGKHEIPYVISNDVSHSNKILDAMKEWMQKVTCLRFVQRSNQNGYLYFYRGRGCSSYVGYQGGRQSVSLASGCMYHGIILHEIGHALGFWHEQSRSDRDQYITIHWENIKPGKAFNFRKLNGQTDDKSHGYDYDSIMHYGPKAFSKDRSDTITAKNGHSIGQRRRLSAIDVQQANTMYTECKNGSTGEGGTANCTFDNDTICNYQHGFGQFDWTVRKGTTPSSGTGPTSDVSGTGYYLYIEASRPQVQGDKATILTPYLNGPQCMKFFYHMYGVNIGSLNIFVDNQRIFSKSGNQGNQWVSVQTPILQSGKYMVKFEGTRGHGYRGDIAIDAISFTPGSCSFQTPAPPAPPKTTPTQTPTPTNPPIQSANCNFDNGTICSYQNGNGEFNWKVQRGRTPSVNTGPTSDLSGRGYYLYIETSRPRVRGDKATIVTPYLNGPQCMKFSYHMYGEDIGSLDIFANNQRIFSKLGNQGNQWVSVQTPTLQSGKYMVKIEGIRGGDYQGDIAIDAISFTPGSCSFQTSAPPTNPPTPSVRCNFDQGYLCSFTNTRNDDFDWKIYRGSTPSYNTGPSRDVSGSGFYIYIETSRPRKQGEKANLVSPPVNGVHCVKFSYHMHGAQIGYLKVYQKVGTLFKELFTKSGSQGNQWKKAEVQANGASYSVVFSGVRGSDYEGDIALDEISITSGQC